MPFTINSLWHILNSHRSFLLDIFFKIILLLVVGLLNTCVQKFTCQMGRYFLLDSYKVRPRKVWVEIEYIIHDIPSGNLFLLGCNEIIGRDHYILRDSRSSCFLISYDIHVPEIFSPQNIPPQQCNHQCLLRVLRGFPFFMIHFFMEAYFHGMCLLNNAGNIVCIGQPYQVHRMEAFLFSRASSI